MYFAANISDTEAIQISKLPVKSVRQIKEKHNRVFRYTDVIREIRVKSDNFTIDIPILREADDLLQESLIKKGFMEKEKLVNTTVSTVEDAPSPVAEETFVDIDKEETNTSLFPTEEKTIADLSESEAIDFWTKQLLKKGRLSFKTNKILGIPTGETSMVRVVKKNELFVMGLGNYNTIIKKAKGGFYSPQSAIEELVDNYGIYDFIANDSKNEKLSETTPISSKLKQRTLYRIQAGYLVKNENHLLGKEINLRLPNGEKRSAQFAIVELDDILASHNENSFASSEYYPTNKDGFNVNDRNYTNDKQAQLLVHEFAQNLRPELLVTTGKTPEGTPIITPEGVVISGNNRTMTLRYARDNYPKNFAAYQAELNEELDSFGFDQFEAKIKKFKHPVLVRIDYDFPEYSTQELAKFNQSMTKGKRPTDKAIELSNILNENGHCATTIPSVLSKYERMSDFYSNRIDQKRMMDMVLKCNLLTKQEVSTYYDEQSGFTTAGKNFLESMLASIVLNRQALLAADNDGIKSLRRIVVTTLPTLMKNKGLGENGLIPYVNEAILYQQDVKMSGIPFSEYINQGALFEAKSYSPQSLYINRLMAKGRNAFKKAITGYNESILQSSGAALFGNPVTPEEAFEGYIINVIDEKERRLIERFAGRKAVTKSKNILSRKERLTNRIANFERLLKRAKGERKTRLEKRIAAFQRILKRA